MNNSLQRRCELFIQNYNEIRGGFKWDSTYILPLCANIFTERGKQADAEWLKRCLNLLKQKTGVFSNFRGISRLATAALLAVKDDPEDRLDRALQVHQVLKEQFLNSEYLPVTAMILADLAKPAEYKEIARRTKDIYKLMKNEHPFLTSSEDSTFAALLALSDKSNVQLVEEMEKCYQLMKPRFFSGNAVQSLSHVLALGEGSAEMKCRRVEELFNALKSAGLKYGTDYELPTLGVLALLNVSVDVLAKDMAEVEAYLKKQKGFGALGIGRKQRLMYAGMLVAGEYMQSDTGQELQTAAINGVISLVVAEQVAMCAAIASASAAAASASSSS